jgi:hypothetical protein
VDKVFTYATPHNGIDMRLGAQRARLACPSATSTTSTATAWRSYLAVPKGDDVSLGEATFPA